MTRKSRAFQRYRAFLVVGLSWLSEMPARQKSVRPWQVPVSRHSEHCECYLRPADSGKVQFIWPIRTIFDVAHQVLMFPIRAIVTSDSSFSVAINRVLVIKNSGMTIDSKIVHWSLRSIPLRDHACYGLPA